MSNLLIEGPGGVPQIKLQQGYNSALPITTTGIITAKSLVLTGAGGVTGTQESVVSITGSTAAPTQAQSGTKFLLNRAAGIVVTLPAPVVGTVFRFIVGTANTGTLQIATDAATTYLQGAIVSATTTASIFASAAATHNINVTMNGTTTGGLVGTDLTFLCIGAALWHVSGTNFTSSTTATPFATS